MNKLFLLLFALLIYNNMHSQPFRKMTETTDWYINIDLMTNSYIEHIYKQKDTIINDFTYSKYVYDKCATCKHYIRDTILSFNIDHYNGNQQVIEYINDSDQVLYSFCYEEPLSCCSLSAPIGINPRWQSFEYRDTVMLESSDSLKRFIYFHRPQSEACETNSNEYVIVGEGIGSLRNPFTIIDRSAFEIVENVICAYSYTKLLYWNTLFNCPFDSSSSLNEKNSTINHELIVFQFKNSEEIVIKVPSNLNLIKNAHNLKLSFTNLVGQNTFHKNNSLKIIDNNIYIDSNNFKSGLYFVQLYINDKFLIGKIFLD